LPGGFAIRPVDPATDVAAVVELLAACDVEDVGEPDIPASWTEQAWKSDHLRGAWIVHDDRGHLAASVELEAVDPARSFDAFLATHPRHRDGPLRAAVIAFVRERAQELAGGADIPLWITGGAGERGFARDAVAAGLRHVRVFWHMERDIDRSYEPGAPPTGVVIRPTVDPDDDRTVYEILDETFRGHFGIEPMTFEAWQRDFKDEMYDPTLVLIAEADGAPAGVAANWMPDGSGWVGDLGVREAYRGRGIGAALLRRSFAVLASRGATKARLNVDAENETGATRLYESVGMTVRRAFDVYEARLDG
jgi:mycothiol synthase